MKFLESYINFADGLSELSGRIVSWLTTILMVVVCVNVTFRYVLGRSLLALQDLSWYLFGVIFLIGAAYTLKHNRHVRVDVFYLNFPPKVKVWINFLGGILLLVPFCLLGIYVSLGFVADSFSVGETSPDAGGLPARYIPKAMTPLGFFFLLLQGVALIFKSFLQILGHRPIETEAH